MFRFKWSCGTLKPTGGPAEHLNQRGELYEEGRENYLQAIMMDETSIEALATDSKVLYVSVKDDGTSQKTYAEYLCSIVSEFRADITKVKVVKAVRSSIKSKAEKDYGVLLAETQCK